VHLRRVDLLQRRASRGLSGWPGLVELPAKLIVVRGFSATVQQAAFGLFQLVEQFLPLPGMLAGTKAAHPGNGAVAGVGDHTRIVLEGFEPQEAVVIRPLIRADSEPLQVWVKLLAHRMPRWLVLCPETKG